MSSPIPRLPASPRARATTGAALAALAVAHLAEAAVLRRRRQALRALPGSPSGPGAPPEKVRVLAAEGVVVDDVTRATGAEDLDLHGLDLLDLVPADLPAEPALRFLRRVDPGRSGADRLYGPGGAHETLLLRPSLADRLGTADQPPPASRADLVHRTVRAQVFAARAADVRVAPALRAGPRPALDRWRELDAQTSWGHPYLRLSPLVLGLDTAHVLALAAGTAVAPVPGALALAAWSAKPALVFAGARRPGSLAPPEVAAATALRWPRAVATAAATALAGRHDTRRRRIEALAEDPPPEPPRRAFRARLDQCPWCGAGELEGRIDVGDLFQSKPGRFHLDGCTACGHVFQNPALTPEALAYYYDQFYDGPGEAMTDTMFAGLARNDRRRIDAVARLAEPRSWLDVGTGHGHFCGRARQRWPEARFDGLDQSASVDDALARGWVDVAHRGALVDLAPTLAQDYDVVSMHHYLEHTAEPRDEMAAATALLAPGGLLEIEVPDPESPWARRLGRFWYPWSQPQHLHLFPCANLVAALEALGLDVVSVERGPATLGGDLLGAAAFVLQSVSRSPHLPWLPPATRAERAVRLAALVPALPLMVLAAVADFAKDARLGPDDVGNAYRIVARRPADGR